VAPWDASAAEASARAGAEYRKASTFVNPSKAIRGPPRHISVIFGAYLVHIWFGDFSRVRRKVNGRTRGPARPSRRPASRMGRHRVLSDTAALEELIGGCRLCAERFAATRTAHAPRPVVRLSAVGTGADRRAGSGGAGACDRPALRRPFGGPAARLDGREPDRVLRPVPLRDPADGLLLSGLRRQGRGPAAAAGLRPDMACAGRWPRCRRSG
jgi:hypothetical protein